MAGPTEEVPAAAAAAVASPKSGASEEKASPAAARPRGFWPFGEDKSVHKALGGGKSTDFSLSFPPCSESELVDCLSHQVRTSVLCVPHFVRVFSRWAPAVLELCGAVLVAVLKFRSWCLGCLLRKA
jgi:hypothetical protein